KKPTGPSHRNVDRSVDRISETPRHSTSNASTSPKVGLPTPRGTRETILTENSALHPLPPRPTRTVAVVLAGGSGPRIGLAAPAQLLKIAGKATLQRSISFFALAEQVDGIIVLMTPGFVLDAQKIVHSAGATKVTRVLPGGTSRNATTQLALDALEHLPD